MARKSSSRKVFRTGSKKAGVRIEWYEDTLTNGLDGIEPYINDVVDTVFRYYEAPVENYARVNAPWTDRTSNARNGLVAQSGSDGKTRFLVLAHRVPYGIWLEVRWNGKFAIIRPTLEKYAPEIMGKLEGILDKYRVGFTRL